MALMLCPECSKEVSDKADACPHCGAPRAGGDLLCARCKVRMIPIEQKAAFSLAGIFAVFVFLFGVAVIFANPVFGILVIILSYIIGTVGRSKKTVMTCPKCKGEGTTLS